MNLGRSVKKLALARKKRMGREANEEMG